MCIRDSTRPRGGSTASQLLRRSSLRRSQRPPLTAPHLEHLECGMQFRFRGGTKNLQTTHLPKKRTAAITRPRGGSTAFAVTCVAAHLRRSSLRAAHARSHCVADGARSLRRNAGEAARVCFSRVRFRSRSRCLLVHAPCACAVRVCAGVTHVAGLRRHG